MANSTHKRGKYRGKRLRKHYRTNQYRALKFNDKPETAINFFGDLNGRLETNITSTQQLNDHWNQSVLLHGNATLGEMDFNKDGFLDQPTGNQINAAYLLNYNDLEHSGLGTHFGISFVKDERFGGQTNFNKNKLRQNNRLMV